MKLGIVGTGNVGCAIALAAVTRGSAREIVLVNRTRKTAEAVATEVRYGTPLTPKVDVRDGDYADLAGAGVSARIAEIVLGDEHSAIPIGSYQHELGVTLSLPSVAGRAGVVAAGTRAQRRGARRIGEKRANFAGRAGMGARLRRESNIEQLSGRRPITSARWTKSSFTPPESRFMPG